MARSSTRRCWGSRYERVGKGSGRVAPARGAPGHAPARCFRAAWLWHTDRGVRGRAGAQAGFDRLRHGVDRYRPNLFGQRASGDGAGFHQARFAQGAARCAPAGCAAGDRLGWFGRGEAASGADIGDAARHRARGGADIPHGRAGGRHSARCVEAGGARGGGFADQRHAGIDDRGGGRGFQHRRADGAGRFPARAGGRYRCAGGRARLRHRDLRGASGDAGVSRWAVCASGEDHRVCVVVLHSRRAGCHSRDAG